MIATRSTIPTISPATITTSLMLATDEHQVARRPTSRTTSPRPRMTEVEAHPNVHGWFGDSHRRSGHHVDVEQTPCSPPGNGWRSGLLAALTHAAGRSIATERSGDTELVALGIGQSDPTLGTLLTRLNPPSLGTSRPSHPPGASVKSIAFRQSRVVKRATTAPTALTELAPAEKSPRASHPPEV